MSRKAVWKIGLQWCITLLFLFPYIMFSSTCFKFLSLSEMWKTQVMVACWYAEFGSAFYQLIDCFGICLCQGFSNKWLFWMQWMMNERFNERIYVCSYSVFWWLVQSKDSGFKKETDIRWLSDYSSIRIFYLYLC